MGSARRLRGTLKESDSTWSLGDSMSAAAVAEPPVNERRKVTPRRWRSGSPLFDEVDDVDAFDEVDEVDEERLCVGGILGRARGVRGVERLDSDVKAIMTCV